MNIKISKGRGDILSTAEVTSSKVDEMKEEIRDICFSLSKPHRQYDVKQTFNEIKQYVANYDRLLYAEISSYCYKLSNEDSDNFQGNLHSLVEYIYSSNYENGIKSLSTENNIDEVNLREKTKRIVIKLYDNVNLAYAQINSLKRSEEELREAVKREFCPLKEEITKDMSSQLITLVGIFTAIAFLVFGGFDSLLSIFSNLTSQPISKIVVLASLWGLVVCNGLFVFLSCIAILTKAGKNDNNANINKIAAWTNLVFITSFFMSTWTYIVDKRNLGGILLRITEKNIEYIAVIGFSIIIIFFIVCTKYLLKKQDSSLLFTAKLTPIIQKNIAKHNKK